MERIEPEIIDELCNMSDRQIDDSIKDRLQAISGRNAEDVAPEVQKILDDCVRYSLVSDFVIRVLEMFLPADWQRQEEPV